GLVTIFENLRRKSALESLKGKLTDMGWVKGLLINGFTARIDGLLVLQNGPPSSTQIDLYRIVDGDIVMAHKKGQGSSRNGRDSNGQRRGVKKYGGEYVVPGNILV